MRSPPHATTSAVTKEAKTISVAPLITDEQACSGLGAVLEKPLDIFCGNGETPLIENNSLVAVNDDPVPQMQVYCSSENCLL